MGVVGAERPLDHTQPQVLPQVSRDHQAKVKDAARMADKVMA